MAELNVGSDPINPAYYAGTACAEIIEYMPANVAFAAKYAWRLGEKDSESQEAGKAIWYLEREFRRLPVFNAPPKGYYYRARALVAEAHDKGKLNTVRAMILYSLVDYTCTGEFNSISRAITGFNSYID